METTIDTNALGEKIVKVLKTIFDPEIPVDIYELGLIYDVFVNEDYDVKVLSLVTGGPLGLVFVALGRVWAALLVLSMPLGGSLDF